MKQCAPFLKMYTEFVKNFDNAMNLINAFAAKCSRFAAIMEEIHVSRWSRAAERFPPRLSPCTLSGRHLRTKQKLARLF